MTFGGIQKNSLIDFPGKVACVLFVQGCNFRCPYCHNPQLVKKENKKSLLLDEDRAIRFLLERKDFLDGVVISGGEPTLHKGLYSFCQEVKSLGYAVKLDTNGSRPAIVKRLIDDGLLDYVAMDVKTDIRHYADISPEKDISEAVLSSIEIILNAGIEYEFRTTCAPRLVSEQIIRNIARMIKGSSLYILQDFKKQRLLEPEYFHNYPSEFTPDDLNRFKEIAGTWVKRCAVRR